MAANPTLVQSVNAVSSAAGPTTITPTFAATQVGSFLLISVFVAGTTVSITTPAGWTLVGTNTIAGVGAFALFMRPNNPGGITSVAITVQAVAGSAVASGFEYTGMAPGATFEAVAGSTSAGNTRIGPSLPPASFSNELIFFAGGFNASTTFLSFSGNPEWSANVAGGSSTLGTPNLTIVNFWGITSGPGGEQAILTINASVLIMGVIARFQTGASGPIWGAGQGPEGTLGLSNSPNPQGSWSVG